jgi:hypothetical protein
MGVVRDWNAFTGGTQGVPVETGTNLSRRIGEMFQDCMVRAKSNRDEALELLQQEVRTDRRMDPYIPERLAERVNDVWQSGRSFDWDDPYLKGGQPRSHVLRGRY